MYLNLLFALIVAIALIIWIIDYSKQRTNYGIFISTTIASLILVFTVYTLGTANMLADTEILNGRVTSKQPEKVGCRHSYSCNCRPSCSGSGKSRSCTEVCDTCYEHSYDIDWDVYSTIGLWTIQTIDRQGLREPPRWTKTIVGEPVSKKHSYSNYIKASPQSIFNSAAHTLIEFKGKLPLHPIEIYDYWHTNRLILDGVILDEAEKINWNTGIAELLKDIGGKKQVNTVVVLTNNSNSLWANALQTEWMGGKKNETVIVIGVKKYPEISWVHVFSWAQSDIFNIKLRDDIRDIGTLDRSRVLQVTYNNIDKYFSRKPMKTYQYLESELEPDLWILILAVVLGVVPFGFYLYRDRFV